MRYIPLYSLFAISVRSSLPRSVCLGSIPRLKKRVALLCPPAGDLYAVLDAAKVADSVLFLLSPDGADEAGTRLLSAVFAHGVSSCAQVVLGLQDATPKVGSGGGGSRPNAYFL